jgi:hypothetical protein
MTKKMTFSPVRTVIAGPLLQKEAANGSKGKIFGQGPQRPWVRIKGHWIPDNEESTDTPSRERDCVFKELL